MRTPTSGDTMELERILNDLRDPGAYEHAIDTVEIVHTHASAVVLAGEHVYKLKKPVDLGFLDYSTLAKRRHMCEREVELNRPRAPGVYLGVVPIVLRDGRARVDGAGATIEYAVHMQRLPDSATLSARVQHGELDPDLLLRIGRTIAAFHRTARRGPDVSRHATFDAVRTNCLDNFAALVAHVDVVAPRSELLRLQLETEAELDRRAELIDRRAAAHVPCDTHGDLRLEHVYAFDDGRLAIVDCIEFSERFRSADPVSDVAFLAMDLRAHGAWRSARALMRVYFEESGDEDGRALEALYVAYRSAVRAKVRAMQAAAPGIPADARAHALQLARAHVQLAVGELAPPGERPCLILVGGLPGTGKSMLSRNLTRAAGFRWLRADSIRKELAGLDPLASASAEVRAGIYTPEWNDRTYGECLARAKELLFSGSRVLVDASFKEERRRLAFVDAARDWGVPVRFLVCTSQPELVKDRLAARTKDPSDADWKIYEHVQRTWDAPGPRTAPWIDEIDTSGSPEQSLALALDVLTANELQGTER